MAATDRIPPAPHLSPGLRFPSIEGLRAFEAAARLGSFERAADELCVTASAVSKRVLAVEELIGAPLFTRGPKALSLTASGREYLEQVKAALALLAAMPQHQRANQRALKLRITTPPTFARQVLVPLLPRFTRTHPRIELELVLSVPYLDRNGADSDIEVRHGNPEQLAGTVLLHERVTPLAAPALLGTLPPLRRPADLAHAPLLRTPIQPWAGWFRAAGIEHLAEPADGARFVDLGLVIEAAVDGQGIALARPSLAQRALQLGHLVPLFDVHARPAADYVLMPHAGDEAAAPFAAWLQDACGQWAAASAALLEQRLHAAVSGRG